MMIHKLSMLELQWNYEILQVCFGQLFMVAADFPLRWLCSPALCSPARPKRYACTIAQASQLSLCCLHFLLGSVEMHPSKVQTTSFWSALQLPIKYTHSIFFNLIQSKSNQVYLLINPIKAKFPKFHLPWWVQPTAYPTVSRGHPASELQFGCILRHPRWWGNCHLAGPGHPTRWWCHVV